MTTRSLRPQTSLGRLFRRTPLQLALLLALPFLAACGEAPPDTAEAPAAAQVVDDPHSYAEPWKVAVEHLSLDLAVNFDARRIEGVADLTLDRRDPEAETLVLDTHGLEIRAVTLDGGVAAEWELGEADPTLGAPLTVDVGADAGSVQVTYASDPGAEAVQWLDPEQTAGGEHPFLFTQSQAILARTWIPLQDTPSVRITYDATVRVPGELMAVMSAENPTGRSTDGVYTFDMPQPIPSYLLALAVGDLEFRDMGGGTGVYAEPSVVEAAAWEFAETEEMMAAAERLYGPYRWGRYDILVLPPSFPFGGMENPRLTFATPTILAGDRSLVALVAHELGHSWSGNLTTNATWDDFWLNEGFTTYVEGRLMEELRGAEYAAMLAALSRRDLEDDLERMGRDDPDTALHLDLEGRNPDDGMNAIAYDKGALFLRTLEQAVGRERWDPFLRSWFDEHAFEPVTSEEFVRYLESELLEPAGTSAEELRIEEWIYQPGLPDNAAEVTSERFAAVDAQLDLWLAREMAAAELETADWTTHEWLHFLRGLPDDLDAARLAELDAAFSFSDSGNSEVLTAWLLAAVAADYDPADPALEEFLTGMGRRKFLAPLYGALVRTPEGRERALEIYRRARPGYHAISRGTIDSIVGWDEAGSEAEAAE